MRGTRNTENATRNKTRLKRGPKALDKICATATVLRARGIGGASFHQLNPPRVDNSAGAQILKTLYNRCATSPCTADAFSPTLPSPLLRKKETAVHPTQPFSVILRKPMHLCTKNTSCSFHRAVLQEWVSSRGIWRQEWVSGVGSGARSGFQEWRQE